MKRFVSLFCALALAACVCSACTVDMISSFEERTLPPDAQSSPLPVPPQGGDVTPEKRNVTLYYRYNNEAYLAPYTAQIDVTSDKPLEQIVIERLIQGPDGVYSDYSTLIDPSTKVVSIKEYASHLEITLSEEYLEYLTPRQSLWDASSDEFLEEVRLRKQLALYSVVDTITELGKHSRVVILLERSEGTTDKLKRSEAGIDLYGERAMDSVGRDITYVLTVNRCASLALSALRDRNWSRLSMFIAPTDVDGSAAPYSDELSEIMQARPVLIEYEISDEATVMPSSMSPGTEQAALGVTARFRDALGNIVQSDNISVRLIRHAGVWRLSYASLDALVPAS